MWKCYGKNSCGNNITKQGKICGFCVLCFLFVFILLLLFRFLFGNFPQTANNQQQKFPQPT